MSNLHVHLTMLLIQIQTALENADLGEHESIQSAFNALVCAIDDEML